ncbi:MAG: zinc-ribbon domain-containing protein [Candidatus Hodarchaeota archaeon]
MSTVGRRSSVDTIIRIVMILILATIATGLLGYAFGGIFDYVLIFIFLLMPLVILVISVLYRSSSEEGQAFDVSAYPDIESVYYEETGPEEGEPKTPGFLCPDCGHKNPRDADFCIRCGQDLDITDDVARY